MNLSAAIMLVDKTVRPVKVEYDPIDTKNNNPMTRFKTINPNIQVGDLVICQTHTRYGFTIVKVVEVDFPVDFNSSEQWGWVGDKFDKASFDNVLKIEESVKGRVAKAEENRMREQLKRDMGLADVDFTDLLISHAPADPGAAAANPGTADPL